MLDLPPVGTIVKVKGPGGFLKVVDPKTRKSIDVHMLFTMGENGKLEPYSRDNADYRERLTDAVVCEVTEWR